MTSTPTLYAIGVGPGASDLMTLRAVRLLQSLPVIGIPVKHTDDTRSMAWDIVTGAIAEHEMPGERCYLHFPMVRDHTITVPAWRRAAEQLAEHLRAGRDVGFILEGDPSVYGTWSYIQEELRHIMPDLRTEIVPAVSSITAVPSVTGIPLVDGEERFCVVPALYGIQMLPRLLEEFDTIMLIKAGNVLNDLIPLLERHQLLDCATYVSHATGARQECYTNLRDVPDENRYFAMIQLSVRGRRGVLRFGTTQAERMQEPAA